MYNEMEINNSINQVYYSTGMHLTTLKTLRDEEDLKHNKYNTLIIGIHICK